MKIKIYLLLFLFSTTSYVFSQKTIYGKVVDQDNNPIIGATIYLNNTSNWTTSNEEGEFEITIYNSNYNLIVTYLGYESLLHKITPNSYNKRLVFTMREKINKLNEVVVKAKKMSKIKYGRYMLEFKSAFLGTSKFARDCVILNKEVLHFSFDKNTGVLKATAKEPLKIRNNSLGYIITYDLTLFEKSSESISYLGYSQFQEIQNSSKQSIKRWKKNRRKAYKGSLMHFLRSLVKNNYEKQGFVVDYQKRIKNPRRPSDSILKNTAVFLESLVSPSGDMITVEGLGLDFDSSDKNRKKYYAKNEFEFLKKKDSALSIINKARLPKTKNKLLRSVKREEFAYEKDGLLYLNFYPYIKVKYTREGEDQNYPSKGPKREYQISRIQLTAEAAAIDSFGTIINPLHVIAYDYMGYEKFGDTLPLNYQIDR